MGEREELKPCPFACVVNSVCYVLSDYPDRMAMAHYGQLPSQVGTNLVCPANGRHRIDDWNRRAAPPADGEDRFLAGWREGREAAAWKKMAVECGAILEGLRASVEWEIAPSIMNHIADTTDRLRVMMNAPPPPRAAPPADGVPIKRDSHIGRMLDAEYRRGLEEAARIARAHQCGTEDGCYDCTQSIADEIDARAAESGKEG